MTLNQHGLSPQFEHIEGDSIGAHLYIATSSFLSPPDRLRHAELAPFKASASDTTSLSQKKRHHFRHDEKNRETNLVSYSDLITSPSMAVGSEYFRTARSKSMPCLPNRNLSGYRNRLFSAARTGSRAADWRSSQRRWTLSLKTLPTRGLSALSPVSKHHKKGRKRNSKSSPAMITLRRATNYNYQSTDITFFPPPTFSNSKSSLVSYFLNTLTGEDQQTTGTGRSFVTGLEEFNCVSPRKLTLCGMLHSLESDKASPAITEVTIEPIMSEPSAEPIPFRRRRCSTKYTTGTSVYEVIWDENDSPISASDTTPRPDTVVDSNFRRQSMAVVQLEGQLFKSVDQTRRASALSPRGSLAGSGYNSVRKLSFQSLLDRSLSRLINESALRGLPRSKASKATLRPTFIRPVNELIPQLVGETDNTPVACSVKVPPLRDSRWTKHSPFESSSAWTVRELRDSTADDHEITCDVSPTEQIRDADDGFKPPKACTIHQAMSAYTPVSRNATTDRSQDDETAPLLDAAY